MLANYFLSLTQPVKVTQTHVPVRPITADIILTAFIHIMQDIVQNFNCYFEL